MKKIKIAKMLVQGAVTVLFAGGIYVYTQTQVKPQEVYKYSRDLPVNTIIQEGDLVKEFIPKDAVTPDMITNKEDIVGKAVSSKAYPGQYAIKQQLVEPNDIDPFETMDLTNYRRVSIEIPAQDAVGGNIKKGDRVDLVSIREGEEANSDVALVEAKIFMQDVLVYNVIDDGGRRYIDKTEGNSVVLNENGEVVESGSLSIVTLAVTAQQAEEIEARKKAGDFKIIGRFEDSLDTSTSGAVVKPNEL